MVSQYFFRKRYHKYRISILAPQEPQSGTIQALIIVNKCAYRCVEPECTFPAHLEVFRICEPRRISVPTLTQEALE